MSVIGIITNNSNIIDIEKRLEKYNLKEKNIIIINKENINNIKNVKFDLIIIFEEIKENKSIERVTNSCKFILINSDYRENLKLIKENTQSTVITFGFNSRATITIISNENDETILEIQREIEWKENKKIECQEIKMKNNYGKKHIYEEISMKILTFLLKI